MATNFPGPYELRLNYTSSVGGNVLTHQMRQNIQVLGDPESGADFDTLEVVNRDTSVQLADDLVDAWVAILRPLLNSTTNSITTAEIWRYVAESFEATFISAYDVNLAGSSGTAITGAAQAIWTFRTAEGGIMKISLMESIIGPGATLLYAAQTAAQKALVDYVLDTDSPFIARDTSFPVAHIALHPGQSEVLFKRRNR